MKNKKEEKYTEKKNRQVVLISEPHCEWSNQVYVFY